MRDETKRVINLGNTATVWKLGDDHLMKDGGRMEREEDRE